MTEVYFKQLLVFKKKLNYLLQLFCGHNLEHLIVLLSNPIDLFTFRFIRQFNSRVLSVSNVVCGLRFPPFMGSHSVRHLALSLLDLNQVIPISPYSGIWKIQVKMVVKCVWI